MAAPDTLQQCDTASLDLDSPTGTESPRSLRARLHLSRPPTQERLDAILETARQRAESLGADQPDQPDQPPPPESPSPSRRPVSFARMEPLLRSQSPPLASSAAAAADERTGITSTTSTTSHGHGHVNYQTITTATETAALPSTARARKPASDAHPTDGSSIATTAAAATPSRWKTFLARFQSIELENKGSVARDHLALERTFLAWLRTSLAFASIGIAVTQLFRLNVADSDNSSSSSNSTLRRVGRPLGTTFLAISVLVLFLGYHRYDQSQQWILRGKFPASRGTVLLVSLVALALMVASLVVVVVVQPD